jgi:hypothetical protein
MKPILRSFFSSGPGTWAKASFAAASGKNCAMAASAVLEPTVRRNRRRLMSVPKMPFITVDSTTRESALSMSAPSGSITAPRAAWLWPS